MPRPESAYKSVIIAIHARRRVPFAIWEIAYATKFQRPTVSRIMDRLKYMGYLNKAQRGFNHKVWRTRNNWPAEGCHKVIEQYEMWQLASGDHTVDITQ